MIPGKPTREFSIGEIISTAFSLYSARFLLLVTPYLLGAVLTGLLSIAISTAIPLPPTPPAGTDFATFWNWFGLFISTLIVMLILLGIMSLVVGALIGGIVIKCISDVLEKGTTSLLEGFTFALSKLPSLIGAQLLSGIIIGIGLLLFVVPGIIFAVMFSLVIPTIVIEQVGVFESLGRSRKLVSNRWGMTFVLLLIFSIIILVTSWISSVIASPFGPIGSLVSGLIASLVSPILPIGTTLLYYSMRAREIPPPPPPPPPF